MVCYFQSNHTRSKEGRFIVPIRKDPHTRHNGEQEISLLGALPEHEGLLLGIQC